MTGYILDDLALSTGLTPVGSEHHRRELSRLLRAAIDGGPTLDVPALCLTEAATSRQALAGHLAELIAAAPPGAIDLCGLTRTDHLDTLRINHPELSWPAVHAANHALSTGLPILTPDATRYTGVPVNVLSL
ncbi:hypothetical protein [Plantactinospora soyae]|uniref:PIN domain-containing protein n=1 Tax=Plantactinospora soyae TaxID=1544732 RepID=A0A927QWK8_9ACTN|nr:hypothetical protein [Plantactinospora soyae]MBE1485672.1 hypothetical protein [Plantactinospora soyae]